MGHMYKHSFFAGIIAFTCFILATPSLGGAETLGFTPSADNAMHSMKALKAETEKLGAAKVQGNDLYFGNTKASDGLIDAVVQKPGVGNSLEMGANTYGWSPRF